MLTDVYRITFREYFWTPLPFLFLLIVALIEGCIASKFLKKGAFIRRVIIAVFISNITGYFLEYFLSVILNAGHIMLVWIPWVKIIGTKDLLNYMLSFPLIFIVTLLVESSINWLLLKRYFASSKILKTTLWTNLISLLILIIVFNFVIFNIIRGEAVGTIDDYLPAMK